MKMNEEFDDYEDIEKAVTEVQRLLRAASILGIIAIALIVLKYGLLFLRWDMIQFANWVSNNFRILNMSPYHIDIG